jgi:hypothetical protein
MHTLLCPEPTQPEVGADESSLEMPPRSLSLNTMVREQVGFLPFASESSARCLDLSVRPRPRFPLS